MVKLGTNRIENFPLTEAGMTVLDPGAATCQSDTDVTTGMNGSQKAPSIPCNDKLGFPSSQRWDCQQELTHSAHELRGQRVTNRRETNDSQSE